MDDFPTAYALYKGEISLPVYYDLTDGLVDEVVKAVQQAVEKVLG